MRKIVVFEEIHNLHRWAIKYYSFKGYTVYFLRINIFLKDSHWVKTFLQKNIIKKLDLDYFVKGDFDTWLYENAFDNIETFYKEYNDSLTKSMAEVYDTPDVELCFKNKLTRDLARFYYLDDIIAKTEGKLHTEGIYFVPYNRIGKEETANEGTYLYKYFLKVARKRNAQFYKSSIKIVWWAGLSSYIVYLLKRYFIYIKAFLFALFSFFSVFYSLRKHDKKQFKYGIAITSAERQFANDDRKVDFILDGKKINKQNTVFFGNQKIKKAVKRYLSDNTLIYINRFFDCVKWRDIKKGVTGWLKFFKYQASHPNIILDTYINLLFCFIKWSSFANQYQIDNLITHADYGAEVIARNALLKKRSNISIWLYVDTVSAFGFYKGSNKDDFYKSRVLGFMNYDYLISWSESSGNYYKKHFHKMKEEYSLGCFWAEHIMEFQKGLRNSKEIKTKIDEACKKGYKVIAVYDIGFRYLYRDDASDFAKDIMKLLDQNKDYFIIFKRKKPSSNIKKFNREIFDLYEKLRLHPRAYFPSHNTSPSEVSAFSEIIISFPFTSPTVEALSARKKALYYDPKGSYKESYYDKFPGLVCHSYDELNKRVRELIYFNEDAYGEYLDKHIKPDIAPYIDGKALTRFRELLTQGV